MLSAVLMLASLSGCVRNHFLQFSVLQVRAHAIERDIEAVDRAATLAGFEVTRMNYSYEYENRPRTTLRGYETPARCCFSLSLTRWDDEPLLEVVIHDKNRSERPFEPTDCAMYARFREAVVAAVGQARIAMETRPCK